MANPDYMALVERAIAAREQAYAPYSRFLVGAALLDEQGRILKVGETYLLPDLGTVLRDDIRRVYATGRFDSATKKALAEHSAVAAVRR